MKKSPVISFKYFFYDFVRITGWPLLVWFRPKLIYISKETKKKFKGGLILMSNHISMKDPLYLLCSILKRRHHFMATKEMFDTKFKKWWFTHVFLCIEINRDNFSLASFKDIIRHLEMGDMVTIFPEGHVNFENDQLNAFKGGIAMMALKTRAPIIPVYIKKKEHWYSRLTIYIGDPIDINDYLEGKSFNVNDVKNISLILQNKEKELEMICNKSKKVDN